MANEETKVVVDIAADVPVETTNVISKEQLKGMLLNLARGCYIVQVKTRTIVPLLGGKSNPLVGKVVKFASVNGCLQYNYEDVVNNQRVKEGLDPSFVSGERTWGTRLAKSCIVEHKGNFYISVLINRSDAYHYEDDNGKELDKDFVHGMMSEKKEGQNQGVENVKRPRDYKVESITAIKICPKDENGRFMKGIQYTIS